MTGASAILKLLAMRRVAACHAIDDHSESINPPRVHMATPAGSRPAAEQTNVSRGACGKGGKPKRIGRADEIRSHFKHNVFMLDEAGHLLEHLGGIDDYLPAAELYEVAVKRWPKARIQLRDQARIVYDSNRGRE